MLASDQKG